MLFAMISASSGRPALSAMPRKRPQWNGIAPPPCGMISRSFGKSLNRSERMSCTNAIVSAVREYEPGVCIGGLELPERLRVGCEVIRAGRIHRRMGAARDVHHAGHVELDHLLVERIPPVVGQRRGVGVAARRNGDEEAPYAASRGRR